MFDTDRNKLLYNEKNIGIYFIHFNHCHVNVIHMHIIAFVTV